MKRASSKPFVMVENQEGYFGHGGSPQTNGGLQPHMILPRLKYWYWGKKPHNIWLCKTVGIPNIQIEQKAMGNADILSKGSHRVSYLQALTQSSSRGMGTQGTLEACGGQIDIHAFEVGIGGQSPHILNRVLIPYSQLMGTIFPVLCSPHTWPNLNLLHPADSLGPRSTQLPQCQEHFLW